MMIITLMSSSYIFKFFLENLDEKQSSSAESNFNIEEFRQKLIGQDFLDG